MKASMLFYGMNVTSFSLKCVQNTIVSEDLKSDDSSLERVHVVDNKES